MLFRWASESKSVLVVDTDAGSGGSRVARKSSSGFCSLLYRRLLLFAAKSQAVIALSTSESEFFALDSATAIGLGLAQLVGS